MKLYEITEQLYNLLASLDDSDNNTNEAEEIRIKLDLFAGQFEFKAEQIGKIVLNYQSDITQLEAEQLRLEAKRKALENRNKSLKKYLLDNMNILGITQVKGDVFNINVRNNPPSVVIPEAMELDANFTRIIPERREPDKVKILAHFKETGEIVTGAKIETSQRIEIK